MSVQVVTGAGFTVRVSEADAGLPFLPIQLRVYVPDLPAFAVNPVEEVVFKETEKE